MVAVPAASLHSECQFYNSQKCHSRKPSGRSYFLSLCSHMFLFLLLWLVCHHCRYKPNSQASLIQVVITHNCPLRCFSDTFVLTIYACAGHHLNGGCRDAGDALTAAEVLRLQPEAVALQLYRECGEAAEVLAEHGKLHFPLAVINRRFQH